MEQARVAFKPFSNKCLYQQGLKRGQSIESAYALGGQLSTENAYTNGIANYTNDIIGLIKVLINPFKHLLSRISNNSNNVLPLQRSIRNSELISF